MSSALRALGMRLFTLFVLSMVAFGLAHAGPDPAEALIRANGVEPSPAALQALRHRLGLDRSLAAQYGHWLTGVFRGDFGISFASRRPVAEVFGERLPATLKLAGTAFALAVVVSLAGGLLAASRRHGGRDWATWVLALLGASVPTYFLGLLLAYSFGVRLRWLPVAGNEGWRSLVLPAVTLALGISASNLRLFRASLLAAMSEPWVITARAKGLSELQVLTRHAGHRALGPTLQALGVSAGYMLGGAVVVETVFAWPGVGKLAVDSVISGDFPMVQAYVVVMGAVFVATTLVVDVVHARVDPTADLGLDGDEQ